MHYFSSKLRIALVLLHDANMGYSQQGEIRLTIQKQDYLVDLYFKLKLRTALHNLYSINYSMGPHDKNTVEICTKFGNRNGKR